MHYLIIIWSLLFFGHSSRVYGGEFDHPLPQSTLSTTIASEDSYGLQRSPSVKEELDHLVNGDLTEIAVRDESSIIPIECELLSKNNNNILNKMWEYYTFDKAFYLSCSARLWFGMQQACTVLLYGTSMATVILSKLELPQAIFYCALVGLALETTRIFAENRYKAQEKNFQILLKERENPV